jgi:hypothetical protein
MADIEKDGRTSAQRPSDRIQGSGFEKRGGYAATEPAKPIPKVDLGRAPGAPGGSAQQSQPPGGGSQGQTGKS